MIKLPWPPRQLHPNARLHWAVKAKHTKSARTLAAWETKASGIKVGEGKISITLTFHPPDKRRRDIDGILSACKAYLDGIADGLGVNDSQFSLVLRLGDVVEGGVVFISVGP